MVKLYRLANLDCAVCANKMEKAVKKIKGVKSASVSYINQTMIIVCPPKDSSMLSQQQSPFGYAKFHR